MYTVAMCKFTLLQTEVHYASNVFAYRLGRGDCLLAIPFSKVPRIIYNSVSAMQSVY